MAVKESSVLVVLTTLFLSFHFGAWTAVAEEGKSHGVRMFPNQAS